MNINVHIQKGKEYVWRVAKAKAKDEGISLSELVTKAIVQYCVKSEKH